MFKSSTLAGAAALAFITTATADTPPGTYIGLAAGANFLEDYEVFQDSGEFETGYYVGGFIGYKFDNNIRAEFEASFRENDFDNQDPFEGVDDLSQRAIAGMVNVLYDFDIGEGMSLSLGGGIGAAQISLKIADLYDDHDVVFAYQGIAEFEAMVDDNVGVFVGYNYFVADSFNLEDVEFADNYVAHTVKLGVKYHFYEPAAAPMIVEPPPPPVAAKTFIVFFNFDKSDLTPEAQAVVAEAAAAFASTGAVSIMVVGHTDTVGSAAYNLPLSQRRAASVKAGLVGNGVPAGSISTDGRGFSDPLVATGAGVKEPQNRRATIDLTGSAM